MSARGELVAMAFNGRDVTEAQAEAWADAMSNTHARDLATAIRTHTATDYARVLATYGPTYANGWRAGRERAAELIEGGEE